MIAFEHSDENHLLKWCVSLILTFTVSLNATAIYEIETLAGICPGDGSAAIAGYSGDGGPATSAKFNNCRQVAVASSGNIYITDSNNACIRKIALDDTVGDPISTVAGTGTSGYSGDGGLASAAQLLGPQWVCVDSSESLYISDGSRIRMIWNAATNGTYTNGYMYTIAGTGTGGYNGDGIAATSAQINSPSGLCVDSSRNIYIADFSNRRIRMIWNAATNGTYTNGYIYTVAGTGTGGYNGDGIAATSAQINGPWGVSVDSSGVLYISDAGNNRIRRFTVGGNISTIAGTGTAGYSGDEGVATSAQINAPRSVCVDSAGTIYIGDTNNNRIRRFTVGGNISTIAGTVTAGYSGDEGVATSATLRGPRGIDVDSIGNIYIGDADNNVIRRLLLQVTFSGGSSTLAVTTNAPIGLTDTTAAAGTVQVSSGKRAILREAPVGSHTLTVDGGGALAIHTAFNSSTTPMEVSGSGTILQVSGAGKLPNAATSVDSGAILQLGSSTENTVASGAIPGAAYIASGGIIAVAANTSVPNGAFTAATLHTGAILRLGSGSTFSQSINVVA
jgi:sugar lactone lactonase YvrE